MKIFTKRFYKTLSKLQDSFLTENRENKKMLDTYIKFAEGSVSEEELRNCQLPTATNIKESRSGYFNRPAF